MSQSAENDARGHGRVRRLIARLVKWWREDDSNTATFYDWPDEVR